MKMLCPARFVVDATENSKGGVAAEVCGSQIGYDSALFSKTFIHVYVRTTYTTNYIRRKEKNKETPM